MFLANVLDTKIVDHEAEGNGTGCLRGQLDVSILLTRSSLAKMPALGRLYIPLLISHYTNQLTAMAFSP
jgi:hypothetical protein